MTSLSELTTLHLGGPARRIVACGSEDALLETIRSADTAGEPLLVLAGGSNVVVADEGFPGTVTLVRTGGVDREESEEGSVVLSVEAGESWDGFVARCVDEGLAGVECLSGIPGSVGATPIQNVGAYGQEVRNTLVRVRVYDRELRETYEMGGAECGFAYRSSIFKRSPGRWVVLRVTFALELRYRSAPIRYPELAGALDIEVGDTAPAPEVRAAVLRLRRGKGMVIEQGDADTVSVGSFFLNPVLDPDDFEWLQERVRRRLGPDARPPAFPDRDGWTKTSAAWLIERAGFRPGYGNPNGIAISSKHTLALTNRGHGSTAELVKLAREMADGVYREFGVMLEPEPVFVGISWPAGTSCSASRS